MLIKSRYDEMLKHYSMVSSWAIWEPMIDTPRSNTNNMSWINDPNLLEKINTGYVFVGLNWSSTHGNQGMNGTIPWVNFHSGYSRQNDYKLRHALQDTKFWGSYITDLIKLYSEVDSNKVKTFLRENPQVIEQNIILTKKRFLYLTNEFENGNLNDWVMFHYKNHFKICSVREKCCIIDAQYTIIGDKL